MSRRPTVAALAALAALVLAAPPAAAYFEQTLLGARGLALGEGAIAAVSDVSALYWNPAALSRLRRPEALADYARPYNLTGLSDGAVAVAVPFAGTGWALAWHRLALAGAYSEDLLTVAAGREVLERGDHRLAAGLAFKLGRAAFEEFAEPGSGGSVDYGAMTKGSLDAALLWTTPWRVDVTWVARDLLEPRYEFVAGTGGGRVPLRHEAAAAIRWNRESTITLGWSQSDVSSSFNAGLEILFFDVFAIRSGVTNLSNVYRASGSPNDMQFAGGFGVFHRGYHVDAAALTNHDLGASYRVTLRVPFGGAAPE